jgi:hypothetical protein
MIMPVDHEANAANALIKSQWLGKEFAYAGAAMWREVLADLRLCRVACPF